MRQILALAMTALLLVTPVGVIAHSQVDGYRVPFLILVTEDHVRVEGGQCYIATAKEGKVATLEAAPTPYNEVVSDTMFGGRMVTESQSPLPGNSGCLYEFKLDLEPAESYSLRLVVNDSPANWVITLDDMSMGEIILEAPAGIKYLFDSETFASGVDAREPAEDASTPQASGMSTVTTLVMVTDESLWKESGSGCVGDGDVSWLTRDSSALVATSGTDTGFQSEALGEGRISPEGSCSWTVPKTPPMLDNGAFTFTIEDQSAECATEEMGPVDDGYFAAITIDEDGIHCAKVSVN